MFEIQPEMFSCLMMMLGMVFGSIYYFLWAGKEKTHWIFLLVVMILLIICAPLVQTFTAIFGFSLLLGILLGISSIAIVQKAKTSEVTFEQCLDFVDAERKKFDDDPEYGFELESYEFVLLCNIVLPSDLRLERLNAYYKNMDKENEDVNQNT